MPKPKYKLKLRRAAIYNMVGEAVMHMKALKCSREEVDALHRRVAAARGPEAQLDVLRELFVVENED